MLDMDEASVRAVCVGLWKDASATSCGGCFKTLWNWAEDTDPLAKAAIIKSTLEEMASAISLGQIAAATSPKGLVTRVSPHPPSFFSLSPLID